MRHASADNQLTLPARPTLPDWQVYLRAMVKQRGFDHETAQETLLLLVEEVGELAKALRKQTGMLVDEKSDTFQLQDEIADVFLLLGCLANIVDIDLEAAVRAKEAKNGQRRWRRARSG